MQRRDFVKAMLAASVSARSMLGQSAPASVTPATPPPVPPRAVPLPAPGPVPWVRGLMEAKPLPMIPLVPDAVAHTQTRFFTREQFATLRQLCEVLMPPLKNAPGALDAGAPEFLDFLISVSPADQQKMYRGGLDRLDAEARQKFGVPFAGVNLQQADALIRPWLRTWMTDHPPREPYERFINVAHSDIRTATINSKPWNDALPSEDDRLMQEGLYWYPVDPDMQRRDSRMRLKEGTTKNAG
jgi:Gluconate 2-dehydrogenase subunit 3